MLIRCRLAIAEIFSPQLAQLLRRMECLFVLLLPMDMLLPLLLSTSQVDRRLIETLFNKFHFAKHCDAIRRYLLLGQGDFVQALMDLVGGDVRA